MIVFVTTAVANPFKLGAMMVWSQKVAAYVKENHDTHEHLSQCSLGFKQPKTPANERVNGSLIRW